jgi:hypothetical protein
MILAVLRAIPISGAPIDWSLLRLAYLALPSNRAWERGMNPHGHAQWPVSLNVTTFSGII